MKWWDFGALFTPSEKTKLVGIDTGAKDDQTGAEIKAAYEAEADTNAYDDAAVSKLGGVDEGADVTGGNPPQEHGASVHTDRTRKFTVYASNYYTGTAVQSGIDLGAAGNHIANYNFKLPEDFVSMVACKVIMHRGAALTGNIVLDIHLYAGAIGESYGAHDTSDNDNVIAVSDANQIAFATDYATLFADITKNDHIYMEVKRDTDNELDTLAIGIVISKIEIEYTADM